MKSVLQFHEEAEFWRESSGSNIETALVRAVKVLALFHIPHYVCGGFAVQEHGYIAFPLTSAAIPREPKTSSKSLAQVPFHQAAQPAVGRRSFEGVVGIL